MTAPATREFATRAAGEIRELGLSIFRAGLRNRTNPETGQLFTEDEIARATQAGSRWYREMQAIDDFGQGEQRRALFLADQLQIDRASTAWLENYHAQIWDPDGRLPATRTGGTVRVTAPAGTVVIGSTTVPDASAYTARSAAGLKYQVLTTVAVPAAGFADVAVMATDIGAAGNLVAIGDVLTWINKDPGMDETCTAIDTFGGGTDLETDAEWAARMLSEIRHRSGGGNNAQQRAWARRSSNAIEDAYIYPCAFSAGSFLIALTQKRSGSVTPTARIPADSTLTQAIAYLTPPGSPVEPAPPRLLVVVPYAEAVDLSLKLQMARGVAGGWSDAAPFPSYHATTPYVSTVTSQLDITIRANGDATRDGWPEGTTLSGTNAPQIMIWNSDATAFEKLNVASIQHVSGSGGIYYRATLSSAPGFTMSGATHHPVCPYTAQLADISTALRAYFDSLGPGELVASTDRRAGRCVRFPDAAEERPYLVGADVATWVLESTWSSAAAIGVVSQETPSLPNDLTTGPRMLVQGQIGVYSL
jgi:uncharacterized phage protein gp47/JayE